MNNPDIYIQIQELLLKWIRSFEYRSTAQIKIACKSLCTRFHLESKSSLLNFLYPLLRLGYIEFMGEGNFKAIPAILISFDKRNVVAGVNLSASQKQSLPAYDEDIFGVVRFKKNNLNITKLASKLNCQNYRYAFLALKQFPSLKDVLFSFNKVTLLTNGFQFYDCLKFEWRNKEQGYGVCRTSQDSQVLYYKHFDEYYKIPSNKENPDARYITQCYQSSIERDSLFTYSSQTKKLFVEKLDLPILIERVLRLNSLWEKDAVEKIKNKTIYSNISIKDVKQLDRIFNTKTEISHE